MFRKESFLSIALIFFLSLVHSPLLSQVRLKTKLLYFTPSEKAFREIYGSAFMGGGEIEALVFKNVDLWFEFNYLKKTGELSITNEKTYLQIIPILLGIRYNFALNKIIHPYIGLGGGYFLYKETNPIGTIKKNNFAWEVKTGIAFLLSKVSIIETQFEYSSCRVNPAGIEVNLGGLMMGLGLGFIF